MASDIVYLTKQGHMKDDSPRQADIEITPEMVEAGALALTRLAGAAIQEFALCERDLARAVLESALRG